MANKIFRSALLAFPLVVSLQVMAQSNATLPTASGQKLQANGLADFGHSVNNGHSMPWAPIAEKDIAKKTAQSIDINPLLAENKAFAPTNSNNNLYDVLLSGIKDGKIKAYSGENDHLSNVLTREDVNNIMMKARGPMAMPLSSVVKSYRVVNHVLELKDKKGQLLNRVVRIALLAADNKSAGGAELKPLFWIYYPETADYLATFQAPAVPNKPSMNWFEVFESRSFKGNVTLIPGDK